MKQGLGRRRVVVAPHTSALSKTNLLPLLQGDLDSLCGLYAIVNAVRLLRPELNHRQARLLFDALGETLSEKSVTAHETVSLGIELPVMHALIASAVSYLDDVLGISLTARSLTSLQGIRRFNDLWGALASRLDGDCVAILGLSGHHEHWTVAYRVTDRTIRLFDSDLVQVLTRSRCSLHSTRVPHQIDPDEVIFISRE